MIAAAPAWLTIAYAVCAALGAFLAAGLLAAPAIGASHRFLGMATASLVAVLAVDVANDSAVLPHPGRYACCADGLLFVLGPALWIYVLGAVGRERPWWPFVLVQFLPAAAVLGAAFELQVWAGAARSATLLADDLAASDLLSARVRAVAVVHFALYAIATLFPVTAYQRRLRVEYAALERLSLGWLRRLVPMVTLVWLAWAIGVHVSIVNPRALSELAFPIAFWGIAALALRHPTGAVRWSLPASPHTPRARDLRTSGWLRGRAPRDRIRSAIDPRRARLGMLRLEDVMALEKPWRNPALTLADLAGRMAIPPLELALLLRDYAGQSFFDFVNARRVAEVQRCLASPAYNDQSIAMLARAAGFESAHAMRSAFRQHARTTPDRYRRRTPSAA